MFITLDVETGGIGPDYSLLTAYFLATDKNFNKVDDLYLYLKPDDGIYRVCGEALNVNRIDLKVHETKAMIYRDGGSVLYKWIDKITQGGNPKATIIGHNVKGDRDKIVQHLISRGSWEKFISHRMRDTQSTAGFLVDCHLLPDDLSCSLGSLVKYFGIPSDENDFHDAKYDTEKTLAVYQKLVDMMDKIAHSVVVG